MKCSRMLICLSVFQMFVSFPESLVAGSPQSKPRSVTRGISQLVEIRNGKKSCWGVIVQLGELNFNQTIDQDELSVTEDKHGSDLKPIMTWTVDQHRKKLTIQFKSGMGDFGTGNSVTVRVSESALSPNPMQRYVFQISTDIL